MYINLAINRKKIKIRKKIAKQNNLRLTVYKSNKHIYAQVYNSTGSYVITSSSSLDKDFKIELNNLKINKTDQSIIVGNLLAKKLLKIGIKKIVFDRSGFKFHGRIKVIADCMLKHGIFC